MSDGLSIDSGPERRVPKYYQLKERLRERIEELSAGAALEPERVLSERYGVSRTTVRQALQELAVEGRVARFQGRGTFVAPPKMVQILQLTSYTEDMAAQGRWPGSRLLAVERVPAPSNVANRLDLTPGSDVVRIERLRLANGEPTAIEIAYLDAHRFGRLLNLMSAGASLYRLLGDEFGVVLDDAEESIETTLASPGEAALLGAETGSPLLMLSRVSWDSDGSPTEYVKSLYRGDRYRLITRLRRPSEGERSTALLRVRAAVTADVDPIARVHIRSWQDAYRGDVDNAFLDALAVDHPARVWAERIRGEGERRILVAAVEAQVVGFIYFGPSDEDNHPAPVAQVFSIHVDPSWVKRAVGSSLMAEAEEVLRLQRFQEATLWVIHSNLRARRFYERLGWQPDGARRMERLALEGEAGPEVEVVRYRKSL